MQRGSNFTTAIGNLKAALLSDPRNASCHNALGCALVDRAASLAYAASKIDQYRQFHERYVKDFARWQAAQQGDPKTFDVDPETSRMESQLLEPTALAQGEAQFHMDETRYRTYVATLISDRKRREALYDKRFAPGSVQPIEPVLCTKDDGKVFKMTADEAKAAIDLLVNASKGEFARAEALASSDQEKSSVLETEVWAQLVIRRRLSAPGRMAPCDKKPLQNALQAALSLDGSSSESVREAADATIEMSNFPTQPSPDEIRDAVALYRTALRLERRDDLHINARIFMLLEGQALYSLTSSPELQSLLRAAIRADPQNAFLGYIQAAMSLADTKPTTSSPASQVEQSRDVRTLVDSANDLPKFASLLYSERIPANLAVAWHYGYYQGAAPLFVVAPLATQLCHVASAELQAGDPAEAEETLLAVVAMGKKVQTAPPLYPGGMGSLMLGYPEVLKAGYTGLTALYRATNRENDARSASQAAAEAAADAKATDDAWHADLEFGYVDE